MSTPPYPYTSAPPPWAPPPTSQYSNSSPGHRSIYGDPPPGTVSTAASSDPNEIRTIFIQGLPHDVKERELQNLLRWWPGYEACQLSFKGDQPMGFALFTTGGMAVAAKDALQNLIFDSDTHSILHTEMAKKNLYAKKPFVSYHDSSMPLPYDSHKRVRTEEYGTTVYEPRSYAPAPPPSMTYSHGSYPPAGGLAPPAKRAGSFPSKDNPPCNTLFVGNLSYNVNEDELLGLFSSQPGYVQLKLNRQGMSSCCFVEFVDIASASTVHSKLQGTTIPSSTEYGAMKVQYSKNPFGKGRGSGGGQPLQVHHPPTIQDQNQTLESSATQLLRQAQDFSAALLPQAQDFSAALLPMGQEASADPVTNV